MLDSASEAQRESLARQFSAKDGSQPAVRLQGRGRPRDQGELESQPSASARRPQADRGADREIVELKEREDADRRVAEVGGERGRARAAPSRSGSTKRSSGSPPPAATSPHTRGGEQAEGGGKKGDVLVELGAAEGPASGRIVFEAKDKKLSRNDAWRELNDAMAARAASFGVLVVAGDDRVPAGCEQLTEYEGNKMIVAVDREEPDGLGLEVAYRLAAARVSIARDSDLDVDAAAVRDAAEDAIATLKQAQAIRSTLTGSRRAPTRREPGSTRWSRRFRRSSSGSSRWSRRPPTRPRSASYGSSRSFCEETRSGPTLTCAATAVGMSPALTR